MLCLLLKGEEDRARHSETHEKSTCAPTTGRGGVRRRVLCAKYKFTGREFWVLRTSTSALALFLPAAAKVSGGCQAELAAHLPGLLSHLQDSCPHAVNRSHVQLMIASKKNKNGTGRPSVTPPAPLVGPPSRRYFLLLLPPSSSSSSAV